MSDIAFTDRKSTSYPLLKQPSITSFVYRNRAGGVRDIAGTTLDGVTRRLLLEIAADYEEVAETLDRITDVEKVIRERSASARDV